MLSPSEFERVCRVCLKKEYLQSIYFYSTSPQQKPQDLSDKMRLCSGLSVDAADGLPGNICANCFELLTKAHHFRLLSANSNKILRDTLKYTKQTISSNSSNKIIISNSEHKTNDNISSEISAARIRKITDEFDELFDENLSDSIDDSYNSVFRDSNGDSDSDFYWKSSDGKYSNFYYCLVCGEEFTNKLSLERHTEALHLTVDDEERKKKGFRCYGCSKVSKSRWDRELHEDLYCPKMPPGTKYECRLCSATISSRYWFDTHLAEHRGTTPPLSGFPRGRQRKAPRPLPPPMDIDIDAKQKYICEICGHVLYNRRSMRSHKTKHAGRGWYACAQCPYRTRGSQSMRAHRLRHAGERPYACELCTYRTDMPSSLRVHARRHSGERPYACSHCPYRAINNSNLRKHLTTHVQGGHYRCWACGKRFQSNLDRNDHVAAVHEGRKPYPCVRCDASYTTRRGLVRHAKLCCTIPSVPSDITTRVMLSL